ncbi:alanine--tRNA ligase [Candidatus Gottesmanbacteria bacterium]|nr:alanine--tRNA ligase [Candidatus Gottesmanbacteria bacterium]
MTHRDLRKKFIDFFTSSPRNHKEIPSAPLVPEHDPTVLFITAGMHPLVPYLMGEIHPLGKRLVDIQKSFRTDDIDEVGDKQHFTFFEMLGNWSLGDYFKKEAIEWSFEFLTDQKWLGLDPTRIFISVFEGDADAPADNESIKFWQDVFAKAKVKAEVGDPKKGVVGRSRIFPYPKSKNWWGPAGTTGPCGPDTEMFFDTKLPLHDTNIHGSVCHINCNCGRYLEIWNDVFMQYNKKTDGRFEPLLHQNVDTGMGMERVAAILEWLEGIIKEPDPFQTELFKKVIEKIEAFSGKKYHQEFKKPMRIITDHLRAAVFIIADGITPANKERGYVLRKLIRRAVRFGHILGIKDVFLGILAREIINDYKKYYPEIESQQVIITEALQTEEFKFRHTLEKGLKEINKYTRLNGKIAFDLYQSFGFPVELTAEIAKEKGQKIDNLQFAQEFKKHQDLSRTATRGIFKGGLQDQSEITTKLHTATHLLQQALRQILGTQVRQKGSHITAERLRFDFSYPKKPSSDEIKKVEDLINGIIKDNLPISMQIMPLDRAISLPALTVPAVKYPQEVKVYSIGSFSREVCGGPHVDFTGRLGKFKIIKEEALGTNIRRIYAVLKI